MASDSNISTSKNDPVLLLATYWIRADYMHDLLHLVREEFESIDHIYDEGHGIEFETYMDFWLSALFVTVEGYGKLRLQDEKITELLRLHTHRLKTYRDATYHFDRVQNNKSQFFDDGAINWAEGLHEAFQLFFLDYVKKIEHQPSLASQRKP